uniref:Uncharacterized protein n=1 Tax=Arundo donax TaxID=35708 RepID=A0A0A8Y1C4_ARUDO
MEHFQISRKIMLDETCYLYKRPFFTIFNSFQRIIMLIQGIKTV